AKTVRDIVETCAKLDIEYLTLYAFSTENWNRPKFEVEMLMKLLVKSLRKELSTFIKNNIKLNIIGNFGNLPKSVQKELTEVLEKTKQNNKLTLTLALSYGAREELVLATKNIANKVKNNIISIEDI